MPDKKDVPRPDLSVVDGTPHPDLRDRVVRLPDRGFVGDAAGLALFLREVASQLERDCDPGAAAKFAAVTETPDGVSTMHYNTNPLDRMAFGVVLQQDGNDAMRE